MFLEDAVKQVKLSVLLNSSLSDAEKEALVVLLINAKESENKDIEPWYCETDCYEVSRAHCRGEHGLYKKAKKLCPFYAEENK